MRRTLLATALAASIAAGGATAASAIVGGTAVPAGGNPFMASLQDGSGFAFCGGSVIAPTWVLTAAHCVADGSAADLYVVTGKTDLAATGGQRIAVAQVYVHPAYKNSTHDAALLRLSSATSSPAIRVATAADNGYETAGTILTTAGWGDQYGALGLLSTNKMRQVDVKVVSDTECGRTNFGFDAATGVCAAALLKDSCQGDSGGPLFSRSGAVQIGIVSYGTGCGLPGFPGVYSEVNNTAIRNWISSTAGV